MLVLLIAYLAFVSLGLPDAVTGVAWPSVRESFALSQVGLGGLVIAGIALAPIFPTLISRTSVRLPPAVALHAVGFKVSAAMLGAAAVPFLAGVIADKAGLPAVGWVALATAAALLLLHEMLLRASPPAGASARW